MCVTVTGDFVARFRDLPNQGRKLLGYPAEDEECPVNVLALKQAVARL